MEYQQPACSVANGTMWPIVERFKVCTAVPLTNPIGAPSILGILS